MWVRALGIEAYDRGVKAYQDEFDRLSEIAVDVYHSDRGSFLKAMADAWCKADPSNKRILKRAWVRIITKYSLDREPPV